jgi:antibiotic biosynthesis monooxygenase
MHVSVGRIQLKPDTNRLRFLWHGTLAYLQARRAEGIVHTSVHREDPRTFWNMTVWTSSEAMLAYRNSGSHLRIMRISETLASRIEFRHWQAELVPSWYAAMQRLTDRSAGCPVKVLASVPKAVPEFNVSGRGDR